MYTLETQTWILFLPDDWIEKTSEKQGNIYFEASDETMGLYIATWKLNSEDTDYETIKATQKVEKNSFTKMEGYNFKTLEDKIFKIENVEVGLLDMFDKKNNYRIISKSLVKDNYLVRCSVHDYYCKNLKVSDRIMKEIIESCNMK